MYDSGTCKSVNHVSQKQNLNSTVYFRIQYKHHTNEEMIIKHVCMIGFCMPDQNELDSRKWKNMANEL